MKKSGLRSFWQRLFVAACVLVSLAILAFAFRPLKITVETRPVVRGPLEIVVEDDGRTRIREKYVVSSPLAGRLARIELRSGDQVEAGETPVATLDPTPSSLLDVRARAEAEARVKAAEAVRQRAEPAVELAQSRLELAEEEFARATDLRRRGGISEEEHDRIELALRTAQEGRKGAEYAREIADYELELARAGLVHTRIEGDPTEPSASAEEARFDIRSPITGRVLRVMQESAAVVQPGTPLVELGDPADLEIVVDILSREAVRISAGDPVSIEDWGGPRPLKGRVRNVEPAGFTKISAMGVEEQRVNVIIDLVDPPSERKTLGDDYHIEARVIVERAENVLKIAAPAIFRLGNESACYVVENGACHLRRLKIGRVGRDECEVLEGLRENDQVVVYPSDKVIDGAAVVLP